ncbi:SAM-dependent methyltransferase [Ruegeria atlantica]|uniref:SAM-dependent methyltransferase n=1 Tax=Ruegeria atlantica TaxID=81569 RepID=UPI00147E945A|nr:SAM-dependent methyltransferase [Ruegeria atlantica]
MRNYCITEQAHKEAWEDLAGQIAAQRSTVSDTVDVAPNSKPGSLTILGTGIEAIGVSIGDKMLIERADKVLYCVADPVTVTWLNQIRPDALDLYVLYGEDKVRYTTYMQMAEAQLYWVRQGLNVVVLFYGHPGVFVLSTHRAIMLARREGHKAVMKAAVSALDTLCADLGVDPSNPGLQTYEATEALLRKRPVDTCVNVVLWQVGLIGENGYRRLGYLNNNFSYFVSWLQDIYGPDYAVTNYIGARYPTLDPVIDVYQLSDLHDPDVQAKITGLSTLYIPPKEVAVTDRKVAMDLNMLRAGQDIIPPKGPLRQIGKYKAREMKAFDSFASFKIPQSYNFQPETEASKFMIALRMEPDLQRVYEKDPHAALADPRFAGLSARERSLLATRDSGAIQVACKGIYARDEKTEAAVRALLVNRQLSATIIQAIAGAGAPEARERVSEILAQNDYVINWRYARKSLDVLWRMNLDPWTGVYVCDGDEVSVVILGNISQQRNSLVYVNGHLAREFSYHQGVLKFRASDENPYVGYLRPDISPHGRRRIIGKVWHHEAPAPDSAPIVAKEVDPNRRKLNAMAYQLRQTKDLSAIEGTYTVRTNGRFRRCVNELRVDQSGVRLNDTPVDEWSYDGGRLSWRGGHQELAAADITLLTDPLARTLEFFGRASEEKAEKPVKCYGARVQDTFDYHGPEIADWAARHLTQIVEANQKTGGLLFWHKWEKHNFTSQVTNKIVATLA